MRVNKFPSFVHQISILTEPSPDPVIDIRAPVIQSWNTLFAERVQLMASSHSQEITTLLFSSHRLFTDILDHPIVYGFERGDVEKSGGGIWVDYLHPTSKIHKVIASEIVDFLDCIDSHPNLTVHTIYCRLRRWIGTFVSKY